MVRDTPRAISRARAHTLKPSYAFSVGDMDARDQESNL